MVLIGSADQIIYISNGKIVLNKEVTQQYHDGLYRTRDPVT